MAKTIKLRIVGRGPDTDAPTVDDLLNQIRDYFDILKDVELALSHDSSIAIDWRIVDAHKGSPLEHEVAPFPRQYATDISQRAQAIVTATASGLSALRDGAERPPYFLDKTLERAEKIFERVTNGLSGTTFDHGADLPLISLTPANARPAAAHVRRLLAPPEKSYKEIGSVEVLARGLGRDGRGNRIIKVQHRLTGDEFDCRVYGDALRCLASLQVRDVWSARRLQISGTIYYKALGRIRRVDAHNVRFLRRSSELPDVEDILDEEFTGGLRTEVYLERLRDGSLT